MYPSWGNYGGSQQSQNYGASNNAGGGAGFTGSGGGSIFSSLQEQHLQQMQQLQMLHQKQLQSVLHHGPPPPGGAYNSGPSAPYPGSTWQPPDNTVGPSSYYSQSNSPNMSVRGPSNQPQDAQPPPPPQPHPSESKPAPPPPEPTSVKTSKTPENNPPNPQEDIPPPPPSGSDKPMSLQNQQQQWYKQHLQNLQKMKQEKGKPNQKDGGASGPPPPPSLEPPRNAPPPPPPKEEPPAPPPPPPSEPETPQNPEEAARLQQLQAAAAQWQQVQQQRAGLQYQALMQQHEKLQKILEQYQQLIQQTSNLQTMPAEMQLRHYETQKQQFGPMYQDWEQTFLLWYEQFQSYPHKDQLQDYENQWKQWQQQMNATNAHIQERMATLTAMVPHSSTQYSGGGTMGQFKPEHEPVNQNASHDGTNYPFNGGGGPRYNPVRQGFEEGYDQPEHSFDGPSRFGDSQQNFDDPSRFDGPRQRFDVPRQLFDAPQQRFDSPRQRFNGPPRFDQPRQRFDGPPQRFDGPPQRFDGPQQRFDGPPQRFDGPPQRFDGPSQRFDGPPQRFSNPAQRFDGPPRFESPRQRFDGPSRVDQPPRGPQPPSVPQPRQQLQRPPGPPTRPPVPQQKQQVPLLKTGSEVKQPDKDPKTEEKKDNLSVSENDMANDNVVGSGGFFVQSDPIPQTKKNDAADHEKSKLADGKPSDSKESSVASKSAEQKILKDDLVNSPVHQKNQTLVTPQDSLSKKDPAKTAPSGPLGGRGRGQPPGPLRGRGRGRGQIDHGEFSGPNTGSFGSDLEEQSYDYGQSVAEMALPDEQEEQHWQDPSYEEFHESSEPINEDLWMSDEDFYPPEEEYFEEPAGQYMGRGAHPIMRGRPPIPMGRGGPPRGRGIPPRGRGHPPVMRGGPPMGRGGPSMIRGGPLVGRGYPPMPRGGPAMIRAGPPRGRGRPPMGRGGPPMGRGGPSMSRGGPLMSRGGHQIGPSQPVEGHWDDTDLSEYPPEYPPDYPLEYPPEEDQYWEEWGPPVRGIRGMRPPFPPGRGRPPRGHPPFARGRPPHPAHRPMGPDHYEMDPELDPMYHEAHGHPVHPEAGRGRGIPLAPHEMFEREDEWFDEDKDPAYRRGPLLPPRELMERDETRRPAIEHGIIREKWPPGSVIEYDQGLKEGIVADYGHGEREYRRGPDYPRDDYESHWDREASPSERRHPPRIPPPRAEPYRNDPWADERDRGYSYSHEDRDRSRGELRVKEYRDEPHRQEDPPYSISRSRLSPLPERHYPDYESRPYQVDREGSLERTAAGVEPASNLPKTSVESAAQGSSASGVLALSQRQHEIILKAAQELKLIRELQETKTPNIEPEPAPVAHDVLPDLPAGLLGLEIPADIKNVLKGFASQSTTKEPLSVDNNRLTDYQLSLQTPVVPKTVDYAHGHEPGATVEKISYGERIILRPDPVPSERGYEKEPLGPRDTYSRDYYDRRDPYLERRDYSREREYREKLPDRERYERERFPPRDERSTVGRSVYRERERERDIRERDHSGSRDRDHYGRSDYERELYKQSSLERDRYSRGPSPPIDRRSYEERAPPSAAALPPPSRVEKKPEMKNIDDILKMPGRLSRPDRIVIIMRGLPGSGKSHVAKLIRDKEVHCGGAPPRVIVLDDYFMTEVEKVEKDPDTGRRVKTKVLEYEYEPEMEETYRSSMLKTFKKTLDDGFFPFIILDTVNDRVKHFDQFWSAAKTKGFEVYLAEITADVQTCAKRNVHGRTHKDITKMANNWEPSPSHMVCLDVRSILQDAAIEEVEMEDFNPDEVKELKKEEEEEGDQGYLPKSKWEMDTSEAKLDKLDGLGISGKRKREGMEDFLQLPDDYATRMSQPGKKRVRWADLEEQKNADLKRAIGFVVGQTDWERITDDSGQLAQRALNRTKYF